MDDVLEKAMKWAKENCPNASMNHKAAFANSVQYLVCGYSGGYGGPSLREHLVSWSLAGREGLNEAGNLNGVAITIQYPDGSLPRVGDWSFDKAVEFCNPLCFDGAEKYLNLLVQIQEREYCFDDDPSDLDVLRGK